jgi:glycosyltransferase involved in cell wall biosynthesis
MITGFNANLLSFTADYRTTGIGLYIKHLLLAIHKEKYPLHLFHSEPKAQKFFPDFNHTIKKLDTSNPYLRILLEQLSCPFSLKKNNIDIFHSPMHVLPILSPKKTKTIVTVHDLANFRFPEFYKSAKQKYLTYMTAKSTKKADHIIAVSKSTKNDLVDILGIKESRISVVYNGLNLEPKKLSKEQEANITKKLNLPEKYILFVGTKEPRKNISGLLDALIYLWEEKKEKYNLVLVGPKGWLYNNIDEKTNKYQQISNVQMTGYLTDTELFTAYKNASLFVYPSFYEGFGLPVLEAMSAGAPVICSNTSSLPEVGGDAAEYIDPYKPKQLANTISTICNDNALQNKMRTLGFIQAKNFSWQKTAKQTIDIYNNI